MDYINVKTDAEINKLADLASSIWNEYWTGRLSSAQISYMLEKYQSYNAIKKQLEEQGFIYNIFEDNGKTAGYFGVCINDDYLFLSKLYIKKNFRRQGCGREVFGKIKQTAQQYNKNSIRLTVNKFNTNAINAYKKWGFEQTDAVVADIGSGFVMDDYIMEYKLR